MLDKKVIGSELFVDRWFYTEPSLEANNEGKIVIKRYRAKFMNHMMRL